MGLVVNMSVEGGQSSYVCAPHCVRVMRDRDARAFETASVISESRV